MIKKEWRFFFGALFLLRPLEAQISPANPPDLSAHAGLFANAKEVFRPLMADPREIQLALRMVTPVGQKNLGEVDAGEYFGLYRWELPWQDAFVQWSLAGGAFTRFDLVSEQKDFQVVDFSANMPIDVRIRQWSMRIMPYHISSHLGDDYIKRNGVTPQKYTFDSFKWLGAYEPWNWLRLYGGFNFIIRNEYTDLGRYAVQNGFEWTSAPFFRGHAQWYWATDFQAWERTNWNPTVSTQLGVHIARHPDEWPKLSIYSEYGSGHLAFGQFFQQEESHWALGVRFDIP